MEKVNADIFTTYVSVHNIPHYVEPFLCVLLIIGDIEKCFILNQLILCNKKMSILIRFIFM